MMLGILFLLLFSLFVLAFRLYLYQKQVRELAGQLKELAGDSNQRLTCFLRTRSFLSLCREMNRCIDVRQQSVLKAQEAERDLKYTIACVSHDIRTPLTGASGYLQLLEGTKDREKQREYCRIMKQRLGDLEVLLEELYLYSRLCGGELSLQCVRLQLFPLLCDVLAGFYTQFEQQNREPVLEFPEEGLEITADPQQLRRIVRNLISNALSHGKGNLWITQAGNALTFSNEVPDPSGLHPEHLFTRFYRADASRQGSHAGLGLSISKELMERMNGRISARLEGAVLSITLTFSG